MSHADGSYSLIYHSGPLGVQSQYCGIFYMQTEKEETGQNSSCDCTSDQIQRVLSVLIEIEDYSLVVGS